MTEESPTMPLDRFRTEYFSDLDDDDVDGFADDAEDINTNRHAENDDDCSESEEGEDKNDDEDDNDDDEDDEDDDEETFENRGGDSSIINGSADEGNPPLLALANSIECRFLKKFLKSQNVKVDVADADLLLSAQQALFDNLRVRSSQKPIKGKPAIPPPVLLNCQRICSQELCNKLLKAINGAQEGRPEGRPRIMNAKRSTINGRVLATPSSKKLIQAAAVAKAASNKAIADEKIKQRNADIAANLASGNDTLKAMSDFISQFQVNFPGSEFNAEGEAYYNAIKAHIKELLNFAYDSRECLELIVALESAQVELARKFVGTSSWGLSHLQSLTTNVADIESKKKDREALLARNIALAAVTSKQARSHGSKALAHLTSIPMVRRFASHFLYFKHEIHSKYKCILNTLL